jgi:hypothetical protein
MDDNNKSREIEESFVPVGRAAGDLTMREAGALAVIAGGDASLEEAGAGMLIAGGSATLDQAGGGTIVAGGDVSISDGAVGNLIAWGGATLEGSRVGVLLTPTATLNDSEVVVGTGQAFAIGAGAGLVLFVLGRLLRRG